MTDNGPGSGNVMITPFPATLFQVPGQGRCVRVGHVRQQRAFLSIRGFFLSLMSRRLGTKVVSCVWVTLCRNSPLYVKAHGLSHNMSGQLGIKRFFAASSAKAPNGDPSSPAKRAKGAVIQDDSSSCYPSEPSNAVERPTLEEANPRAAGPDPFAAKRQLALDRQKAAAVSCLVLE